MKKASGSLHKHDLQHGKSRQATQSIVRRTGHAADLTRMSLLVVAGVVMRGCRMFGCNIRHSNLYMLV